MSDYRTMPAGEEMDREIVIKVMGWTPRGDYFLDGNGEIHTIETTSYGSFKPSREWEGMGLVMEMLGNKEYFPCLMYENGEWECLLASDYGCGKASTAPLAVCRAALRAMEGDKN